GLNFVDIAIVFIIIIYAFEGYAVGFIKGTADFISFIISFIFGLTFYNVFSLILVSSFQIPNGIGNSLGFFIGSFICEVSLILIFRIVIMPTIIEKSEKIDFPKLISRIAGIFPGIFSSIVLLAFVLTMIVALPISPYLKNLVEKSRLGEPLVLSIQGFDKEINNIFGGAVNDALTFLTVEPKSEELLKLNFQVKSAKVDEEAEEEMLNLLNIERTNAGFGELRKDLDLRETARKHCLDMLERGYFSHYSPEGRSPFDRMSEDNIEFKYAGENLALAPSTKLAMQGLMRSSGHRANILNKNFGKAGIGVIDAGIYGEMFCQEFTD
ncbi:MAG: CvpA family protein, partial [Nanoarchaeota archaeon]|nr:CvpA family protein [Nanoarchaeota archaeon]